METYIKCSGCKCLRNEATEYEVYKGKRRITCKICKTSRIKFKCEHQTQKSRCKECGAYQICEHQKIKSQCKECGGNQICEHKKYMSSCKGCGGGSICQYANIND